MHNAPVVWHCQLLFTFTHWVRIVRHMNIQSIPVPHSSFRKAVISLRKSGYTDAGIARHCNCSRAYIGRIASGDVKDIGFRIGTCILELHKAVEVMGAKS